MKPCRILTTSDRTTCVTCGLAWDTNDFDPPVCMRKGTDPVSHPPHYTQHPSGVECIQITEHMGFCLGNAIKYIWRADLKTDAIEDLKKARWYIDRELAKREGKTNATG